MRETWDELALLLRDDWLRNEEARGGRTERGDCCCLANSDERALFLGLVG